VQETDCEEGDRRRVKLSAVDQRLIWGLPYHQTEMGPSEEGRRSDPRGTGGVEEASLSSENVCVRDCSEPAKNKVIDLQCEDPYPWTAVGTRSHYDSRGLGVRGV